MSLHLLAVLSAAAIGIVVGAAILLGWVLLQEFGSWERR